MGKISFEASESGGRTCGAAGHVARAVAAA